MKLTVELDLPDDFPDALGWWIGDDRACSPAHCADWLSDWPHLIPVITREWEERKTRAVE